MMQQHPDEPETVNLLDPCTPVDDRVKLSPAARKRLAAKCLKFPLPAGRLPVIMMDEIVHTVDFPVCADPTCICYELERQQAGEQRKPGRRTRKPLVNATYEPAHGDLGMIARPFSILR